ncbi:3'-5' exonuclease [Algoriphagus machipongonensis]|uniref:DNA polymerase III PolC-type (PolIII) n=1 Tax=Algoriphagus machipongonensis TaxID=388413 RepID=A3HVK4_9BACT|nr:3'-5' exonuclease [Algoriphagus machipongonensis]EAZ82176.1 DNA polymerase III PolC-type (PolIII) [Algoriphagus machipongonensis]
MSWWPFDNKTPNQQPFVKDYLTKVNVSIPEIRSLDQLSFVVLDTETTGLNPSVDHILSFGAVKIEDQMIQISTGVEWYLKSSKKDFKTIPVHGLIGNEEAVPLEQFAKRVLEYFENNILVGHHLGFDLEMLEKALKPFGLDKIQNKCIDTMSLAIRLDHGLMADRNYIDFKDYSLDSLCQRYDIKTDDRHTAGGDAFLTANLLLKLLKAAQKKGIMNWGTLRK